MNDNNSYHVASPLASSEAAAWDRFFMGARRPSRARRVLALCTALLGNALLVGVIVARFDPPMVVALAVLAVLVFSVERAARG